MKKGKNLFQSKSQKTEITEPEEIIETEEIESVELVEVPEEISEPKAEQELSDLKINEDDDMPPFLKDEKSEEPTTEKPTEPENADASNKQKIKALKRSIENKTYAIEKEIEKVKIWRREAVEMDAKCLADFEKRKADLEALLLKNQQPYDKKIARTQKFWHEYSTNWENGKIAGLNKDLELLQTELAKLEPKETK